MNSLFENLSLPKQMYVVAGSGITGILLVAIISLKAVPVGSYWGSPILMTAIGAALVTIWLAVYLGNQTARRAEQVLDRLDNLVNGDLSRASSLSGQDEFGRMADKLVRAQRTWSGMMKEVLSNADQLASSSQQLSSITDNSRGRTSQQSMQTSQVSGAMNLMSVAVQDVAHNAANAATAAQDADMAAQTGFQVVKDAITSINLLSSELERTSQTVSRLKEDSDSIGAVLDVIRNIAEQTNLLALNAAIEAARAGEQGRGFAVVADEVRTLASRTQQSTQEIQGMIEKLQAGTNDAVSAMLRGSNQAKESVKQASDAGRSLETINHMINSIKDMNTQIAAAARDQSVTAEEINSNILGISQISNESSATASEMAMSSEHLARLAKNLREHVGRFRIAG